MSAKEDVLRATAGALQPKSFDLSQLRQRSMADGRAMRLRVEDAAGALAYSAMHWSDDGEHVRGNPLAAIMLRLKYANQKTESLFADGAEQLLLRHWKRPDDLPQAEIYRAIALVAMFEWAQDACTKCREKHPRTVQPVACECATAHKDVLGVRVRGGLVDLANGSVGRQVGARAGCAKCRGLGRVFVEKEERRGKGMVCVACNNTGRKYFRIRQRWELVNEVCELSFEDFKAKWHGRYAMLVRTLRSLDKNVAKTIDIQISRIQNSQIEPQPVEEPAADECGGGPQEEFTPA